MVSDLIALFVLVLVLLLEDDLVLDVVRKIVSGLEVGMELAGGVLRKLGISLGCILGVLRFELFTEFAVETLQRVEEVGLGLNGRGVFDALCNDQEEAVLSASLLESDRVTRFFSTRQH